MEKRQEIDHIIIFKAYFVDLSMDAFSMAFGIGSSRRAEKNVPFFCDSIF